MEVGYNKKLGFVIIVLAAALIFYFFGTGNSSSIFAPVMLLIIGLLMIYKTAYVVDMDHKQIIKNALIGPGMSIKDFSELLLENGKGYYIDKNGKTQRIPSSFMYNTNDYNAVIDKILKK